MARFCVYDCFNHSTLTIRVYLSTLLAWYAAKSMQWYGVRPSVCPVYRQLKQRVAGLLLWAGRAGDIDRLLHGLNDSTDSPETVYQYF